MTPTGLTEERWVKAIEIRPKNDASRRVVHHSLAFLLQQEDGKRGLPEDVDVPFGPSLFMEWAVGKAGQIFRPDTGKLMMPGSQIMWKCICMRMEKECRKLRLSWASGFMMSRPSTALF